MTTDSTNTLAPTDAGTMPVASNQGLDMHRALYLAEAALSDIGDADRVAGDDLAWCEMRAAKVLPQVRAALAAAPAQAVPAPGVPSEQQAHDMGAKGAPATEAERLLFEAWMRGHCWALCATWEGTGYRSAAERGGGNDPHAMATRRLWAAWRDRAALAASPTAATATAAPAQARCKSCGTHEVSQQQTCHNSGCADYAQDVTIYDGWISHTPASSPASNA